MLHTCSCPVELVESNEGYPSNMFDTQQIFLMYTVKPTSPTKRELYGVQLQQRGWENKKKNDNFNKSRPYEDLRRDSMPDGTRPEMEGRKKRKSSEQF